MFFVCVFNGIAMSLFVINYNKRRYTSFKNNLCSPWLNHNHSISALASFGALGMIILGKNLSSSNKKKTLF